MQRLSDDTESKAAAERIAKAPRRGEISVGWVRIEIYMELYVIYGMTYIYVIHIHMLYIYIYYTYVIYIYAIYIIYICYIHVIYIYVIYIYILY